MTPLKPSRALTIKLNFRAAEIKYVRDEKLGNNKQKKRRDGGGGTL